MDAAQVQQAFVQMQAQLQQLQAAQQQQQQQAAAAPAASSVRRAKIPAASNFAGTASMLDGWLREMRQQFDWYQYTADSEQVAMAAAQLRGVALDWWAAQLSSAEQSALRNSFSAFEQALRARFQPVNSAQTARLALDSLRQGAKQSAADYISSFRRLLVAVPDMSEADKVHRFVQGLRGSTQQHLIVHGVDTLDKAIAMAARVGSLGLFAASSAAAAGYSSSSNSNAMDLTNIESEEPDDGDDTAPVTRAEFRQFLNAMQQQRQGGMAGADQRGGKRPPFGRGDRRGVPRVAGLSEQEVRKRLDERLCFVCGEAGHRRADCPESKANQSGN
jgi:hypothetical protein